jgi:hypothetical protein
MNPEQLEQWLDEHEYQPDHFLGTVVRLQDLRALFDGKVLVPQGSVAIPEDAEEARAMALLGMAWLEHNAPELLKKPAIPEGMVLVPVETASPVRGIVTGVLPTKKNVEIALEHDAELPILGERVFISSESLFRGVGISGQGHNADWCAGWNACLLLSTKVEPCTYAAMLAASQKHGK